MKILLVGCAREAAAMFKALLYDQRHEITHCEEGGQAIAALSKQGRRYDWAIVDGRAMTGKERELPHILRAMGSGVATDRRADGALNGDIPSSNTSCGVEWTQGGLLQLHCALHSTLRDTRLAAANDRERREGDIVFEYYAPCRKERNGNG